MSSSHECSACGAGNCARSASCSHCGNPLNASGGRILLKDTGNRNSEPAPPPLATAVISGGERGAAWLVWVHSLLASLAELDFEECCRIFAVLLIVGFCGMGLWRYMPLIPLAFLALVPTARWLSAKLWKAISVPAVNVTLTGLRWSAGQGYLQLDVHLSSDEAMRPEWRDYVAIIFAAHSVPSRPLDSYVSALAGGGTLEVKAFFACRGRAPDGLSALIRLPDGRSAALPVATLQYVVGKCDACKGSGGTCKFCGGSGRVDVAVMQEVGSPTDRYQLG